MSNQIRIKRRLKGSTDTNLPTLLTGELAYDETKGKLYIGESDGGTVAPVEIAGSGYVVSLINSKAVPSSRTLTPGSGLFGTDALDLSSDRTFNVGQGTGIIINSDAVNVDTSYVVTTSGAQIISATKQFSSGILVSTTGLGLFTSIGEAANGIYVPSGTIRTQDLVVDGTITVGTKIDISLAAEILAKGTLQYNAEKFIFNSGIGIFTSGLFVGPTGSPTGVSLSGHKHVWTDVTDFCSGVASCVDTQLLGGSGLVLNYNNPNLNIDIGQGDGILVSEDAVSVDSTVVRTTGNQTISGNKTFNGGSTTTVGISTDPNGTGTLAFADGSQVAYLQWDGTNNKLIFDSTLTSAGLDIKKPLRYQVPTTGTSATSIPVFTGSVNPSTSVQTIASRSLYDFKSDLSLNNLTNDAQIKKLNSSTEGYIPVWSGNNGNELSYGYDVSLDLSANNSSSYIPRADAVKTYVDNQLNNAGTIVRTTGDQTISGIKTFDSNTIFLQDLLIVGNLAVSGNTITANVDTMTIEDPILTLGLASGNMIVSDTMDRGLALVRETNLTAFMGWDSSDNEFVMLSSGIASNNSGNYSAGSYGNLRINNLTANTGSFTKLDVSGALYASEINASNGLQVSTNIDIDMTSLLYNKRLFFSNTSAIVNLYDSIHVVGAVDSVYIGANAGNCFPVSTLDVSGVITALGGNSSNWNSAYGWGNHSLAGYVSGIGTGASTSGYISRWNSSSGLNNSLIFQSGNSIGIGTLSPLGQLQVVGTGYFTKIKIYDPDTTEYMDPALTNHAHAGDDIVTPVGNDFGQLNLLVDSIAAYGGGTAGQLLRKDPSNTYYEFTSSLSGITIDCGTF